MKNFLFLSITTLLLSGCVSLTSNISNPEAPLHATLNAIKSELRVFEREITSHPDKYSLSCGGSTPSNQVSFQSIKVDLAVSETAAGDISGESVLVSGPGFTVDGEASKTSVSSDTLTVHIVPDSIPAAAKNELLLEGGIAEALLALMAELSAVNDEPPCLNIASGEGGKGPGATLSLAFSVETKKGIGGGLNFVVIKVGGNKSKTKKFSNTITVNIGIDGQTMISPMANPQ
jgi:hypothetical protein